MAFRGFILLLGLAGPVTAQTPSHQRLDIATEVSPYNLEASDLDRDGRVDLAFVSQTAGTLGIAWQGSEGEYQVRTVAQGLDRPEALAVLDLEGDGDMDIVVAEAGADRVVSFLNSGDGDFVAGPVHPVGSSPHALLADDVDGDGDADLLVSNFRGASV
ncbi:MAG: VCBS repeat-containing protein, partial [Gemmatimonadota bacterium]|nr:VCBS repeat-containing protein [Gemmatimonadota bacterium]